MTAYRAEKGATKEETKLKVSREPVVIVTVVFYIVGMMVPPAKPAYNLHRWVCCFFI